MPWDGTELWVAQVAPDGGVVNAQHVAGGPEGGRSSSRRGLPTAGCASSPTAPAGGTCTAGRPWGVIETLTELEAEFGQPQWVFGTATYDFTGPDTIVCAYNQGGVWRLALGRRHPPTGADRDPVYRDPQPARDARCSPPRPPARLWSHRRSSCCAPAAWSRCCASTSDVAVDPGSLSVPQSVEFRTTGGRSAYAFYYPRQARRFARRPASARPSWSRVTGPDLRYLQHLQPGHPVLDEARHSRARRELRGKHRLRPGLPPAAQRQLGHRRRRRLHQQGPCPRRAGSGRPAAPGHQRGGAGGYTTLCALTFRDVFKAGASYYGVSDLETLVSDDHKFESRYTDRLVGPYPEQRDVYRQRSPIHFVDRLSCPVIFFQGLEDVVVPPSQAETMVAALRAKGLPVALPPLPGGAARLPAGGKHQAGARGGAVLLRPRLRLPPRRRGGAGAHRQPTAPGRASAAGMTASGARPYRGIW